MAARLTRLESAVLDALAWELRDIAPDLAGQVEESLPGLRRNTGAGLYSELIVDRHRPPPRAEAQRQATGLYGTVHAMVGDLEDPIGFQVELRQGRLIALHGQSYGQDTRALDFSTTPFDEVFTVDETGESVLYDPAAHRRESPLNRLHDHPDPIPPGPADGSVAPQPGAKLTALQRVQLDPTPASHAKTFGLPPLEEGSPPGPTPTGPVALVSAGLHLLIIVAGLFLVFALRFSFVFVMVAGVWLLRWMNGKQGRVAVRDLTERLRQAGVFDTLNRAPGSIGKVTSDTSHSSTPLRTRSRP
jgi:hypothetical protein